MAELVSQRRRSGHFLRAFPMSSEKVTSCCACPRFTWNLASAKSPSRAARASSLLLQSSKAKRTSLTRWLPSNAETITEFFFGGASARSASLMRARAENGTTAKTMAGATTKTAARARDATLSTGQACGFSTSAVGWRAKDRCGSLRAGSVLVLVSYSSSLSEVADSYKPLTIFL